MAITISKPKENTKMNENTTQAPSSATGNTLTITYLNRDGGGFAERHTLPEGTTVRAFLEKREIKAEHFTIRIVRGGQGGFTPAADDQLQEGDRLSCVPLKIEGARC